MATRSSYTLTASDQGKTIKVRVRFADDRNNTEARTSDATGETCTGDRKMLSNSLKFTVSGSGQ